MTMRRRKKRCASYGIPHKTDAQKGCLPRFIPSIYLSIGDVFLLLPHPSVRAWTEIDSLGWMAAVIVTRDVEGVDAGDDSSVLRLRRRVRMCSDCICRNISALALLNVIVCTCLQRRQFNFECRGSQSAPVPLIQ